MDTTECFENHKPGILDEIVEDSHREEVIQQYIFTLAKFLLGRIEIEIDVQVLDELGDGVSVGVRFLRHTWNSYLNET